MKGYGKTLATLLVTALAVAVFLMKYWDYVENPWTRNGQVQAEVIQITPRVSAPIVNLPIMDNQFVKRGDLLFELDPRTFAATLAEAEAHLDQVRDNLGALDQSIESAQAAVEQFKAQVAAAEANIIRTQAELERTKVDLGRATQLLANGHVSRRRYDEAVADYESAFSAQNNAIANVEEARAAKLKAEADLAEARANRGARGEDNAQLRAAKSAVETAALNLEFTKVVAPVDGYVTNLKLQVGSQGVANQPALALVDVSSYWVDGFFRETVIGDVQPGDHAVVTLMSYPDQPLRGRVDSIGWGIAQDDGSTGYDLLPNINPTFEWIRLAQRVPVRIELTDVPERVELRVGTTASVLVRPGTADEEQSPQANPAPAFLQ